MVFYLIGLGLNERGISLHGKKILKNCKKIYLENYTITFPYTKKELEKQLKIKVIEADREFIENEKIIDESEKQDVALLIYGSPLSATTHISLINKAIKNKVNYKIIYSASIFNAIAESGLQLYKFGKTASLPKYQKNFAPESFIETIKNNQKINAHTLLLIDIGLKFEDARQQLNQTNYELFKSEKIIVCSQLGYKTKIFCNHLEKIDESKIKMPYCIIIPSNISHSEEEALKLVVR